jgi:protocatechuate 3,4-dioxygenase beta subunit
MGILIGYAHGLAQVIVNGRVRDTNKVAIPDATVTLICAFDSSRFDQVRTDKEGRYEIKLIQPGQYILYAAKPGFMVSAVSIDLGNGSKETREIVLQKGKSKYVQTR